ncbi:MAG: hypothetical protein JWN88_2219 [Frankiales bacterium]|nr:hypothetical protein [Frankiales bacterium]
MQTFLPYPDLRASCVVLDDKRLGKQRVETFQILRALTWPRYAWKNHPAVRMWRGFVPGLVAYGLENCREWTRRGYADTVAPQLLAWSGGVEPVAPVLPPWFGLEPLHLSHRSALLRKDPQWYGPLFASLGEPDLPDDLPYLWPPDHFPRWPVRAGLRAQPVPVAAELLGLSTLRPWQERAAASVADGRDTLLVARPGAGGSTAGLLAGLATDGRTLWVSPAPGVRSPPVPAALLDPDRVRPAARAAAERVPGGDATGPAVAPIARPPAPEDLLAMQAESAPAEFVFRSPDDLAAEDLRPVGPAQPGWGLVVVDRAGELPEEQEAAVRSARGSGGPPLLVVVDRADEERRAALVRRYGLVDPSWVGGGWDPGSELGARVVSTQQAARSSVEELVRSGGPAVVVAPSRERAERLVAGLGRAGLRAALWAPPPLRANRATAALAAWRARRLDALVVGAGALPPLGRARVPLLVAVDPDSLDGWRDLVERVSADRSVVVAGPGASGQVRQWAAGNRLRETLLDGFGEPAS